MSIDPLIALRRIFLLVTPLVLLLADTSLISAQPDPAEPLPTQMTPEHASDVDALVARVYFSDQSELARVATQVDVWEVKRSAGYLVAAMDEQQYQQLTRQGFVLSVDQAKSRALNQQRHPLPGQNSGIPGFACYRTVEETYADLEDLAQAHPDLARWIDIGDSWEKATPGGKPGYDLYVLALTNQSGQFPQPKPRFFLTAATHAREYATAELATRFAQHLVASYGRDPEVTWLLDYYEVHILPVANPDGRKLAESGLYQRKNTNNSNGGACAVPSQVANQYGTDLNRNHNFGWGGASMDACAETYQGPTPASEPETRALEAYLKTIFPDQRGDSITDSAPLSSSGVLVSLHSYSELVLWPWGWTYDPAPNQPELKKFAHKLAHFNNYTPHQSSQLYATTGDTTDFTYGELGVPAFTFELGTDFFQGCESFEQKIYPDNLGALLYAFKSARLPYRNPSGPDSLDLALSSTIIKPEDRITITVTADDTLASPGTPVENIAGARFSIDTPSWIEGTPVHPFDPVDGALDEDRELLEGTIDTAGLSHGRHTIFVESLDAAGHWGVPSAAFLWISEDKSSQYLPLVGK